MPVILTEDNEGNEEFFAGLADRATLGKGDVKFVEYVELQRFCGAGTWKTWNVRRESVGGVAWNFLEILAGGGGKRWEIRVFLMFLDVGNGRRRGNHERLEIPEMKKKAEGADGTDWSENSESEMLKWRGVWR